MNDVAASKNDRPTLSSSWRLVREIIVALTREDGGSGGSFGSRALRSTVLSSLAGAMSGLIPAFVAIGIAGVARGSAPAFGPLAFLAAWLRGAPAYAWVITSLGLVTCAVSFGFVASRAAASFSAHATATLRIAMMKRVIATSPRTLDAAYAHMSSAPRPRAGAVGVASAGALGAGALGAGPRAAPGSEAVKLAVLRDGQMASDLIVAAISNLPQTFFALVLLIVDLTTTGSGLAACLGIGVFVASRLFASRASARVSVATAELAKSDANAFAEIAEKVSHLDDLRLAGAREIALSEVEAALRRAADKRQQVARASAISSQTASLVATLAPLVVLLSLSATGQAVSAPEVARLLIALPLIIARLGAVDALRIAAIEKRPVLVSVRSVLGLASHPSRAPTPVDVDAVASADVVFEDVTFAPPGQSKAILDRVTFRVPAGSVVGLCGASGSGKSTLLRLLLRLDDPTSGRILVGGVELKDLEPDGLPRLFGSLAQGGRLLGRSIEENVTLACRTEDPSARRDLARRTLILAQIPELALDDGLDRRFVGAPASLSGGEQRRVLLARALASGAKLLVLDEPEAGLPKATARSLFHAVVGSLDGRTALVVTHAPSVLPSTFNVVLADGKLVDVGPHEELLARCEIYRTITAEKEPSL